MQNIDDLHKVLLELVIEFDRVCRVNHIHYSISFGTMLGAIRHKGFIPWDDDVDIMMKREDYETLKTIASNEFKDNYFFQSYESDASYPYNIARLRKNGTSMIYDNWKDSGMHQGMYIDICPIDHIADRSINAFIQKWTIIFLTIVRNTKNKSIFINNFSKNRVLSSLAFNCLNLFPKKLCYRKELKAIQMADKQKTSLCGVICEGKNLLVKPRDMLPFKRKWTEKYIDVDFEGIQLMCFSEYEALLKHWYGDYMKLPPKEEQVIYHEPLFFSSTVDYKEYLMNQENYRYENTTN